MYKGTLEINSLYMYRGFLKMPWRCKKFTCQNFQNGKLFSAICNSTTGFCHSSPGVSPFLCKVKLQQINSGFLFLDEKLISSDIADIANTFSFIW